MFLLAVSARKALATVIGDRSGTSPSFAYLIGDYTLDHPGTLASPKNDYLIRTLIDDGHREKEIQIIPDEKSGMNVLLIKSRRCKTFYLMEDTTTP